MVALETDVLVVGAGGAGMYAGIAAAREDARPHLERLAVNGGRGRSGGRRPTGGSEHNAGAALGELRAEKERTATHSILSKAAGPWKDRSALPDLETMREEWERR